MYTTESFIELARSVHGDLYDYSLVDYKNMKTKVKIICKLHGVFMQDPDHHIHGKCGCPWCAGNVRSTKSVFVENAMLVHGDKYDYSDVVYKNNRTPVAIRCPEHGIFLQSPSNHLMGKGCPKCANNVLLTNDEFISQACLVHGNRYGYDNVDYRGNRHPVLITCFEHGDFAQIPYVHLSGCGCPVCGNIAKGLHRDAKAAYAKAVLTFLKKYGVDNPMKVDEIRARHKIIVSSVEVNEKRIATKRKNGTFNTSESERILGGLLVDYFGENDVLHNYSSELYPFNVDYYIRSRNLYIELNAHWSHSSSWYNCERDHDLIVDWKSRSDFYKNCAKTFSERDVQKRFVAKLNNLNYVVFWQNDLSDAMLWFSLGCPDGCDWLKEYSWLI